MKKISQEMEATWEDIKTRPGEAVCRRMRVIGGWVFETWALNSHGVVALACCFIPDPEHIWAKDIAPNDEIDVDKANDK